MTLHKLFLQLFELSNEDGYIVRGILDFIQDARADHKNVGIEFTQEAFKQWYNRVYGPFPIPQPSNNINMRRDHEKIWKIIEGDNLDIIEEIAEKKGLL